MARPALGDHWPDLGVDNGTYTFLVVDDTFYEVLGVSESASTEEIRSAFRRLSKHVHPDRGGSAALFRRLEEAYATLSDPARRAEYDRRLRDGHGPAKEPDSDWVRVDDPVFGSPPPGGTDPPPGQPPPGTHREPPGAADAGPPPPFSHTGAGWPPPEGRPAAGWPNAGARSVGALFARHPVQFVALVGLGMMVIGGALRAPSLDTLGFLVLVSGLIAMAGSRRATWEDHTLRARTDLIDVMSGTEFEMLLAALFSKRGYRTRRVGGPGDFGADLLIENDVGRYVVQAKRSASVVRHDAVQQVVAAVAHYRATGSMVVTNSTFTEHARRLARSNGVLLWDRSVLVQELSSVRSLPPPRPVDRFFSSLSCGLVVCVSALVTLLLSAHRFGSRARR